MGEYLLLRPSTVFSKSFDEGVVTPALFHLAHWVLFDSAEFAAISDWPDLVIVCQLLLDDYHYACCYDRFPENTHCEANGKGKGKGMGYGAGASARICSGSVRVLHVCLFFCVFGVCFFVLSVLLLGARSWGGGGGPPGQAPFWRPCLFLRPSRCRRG